MLVSSAICTTHVWIASFFLWYNEKKIRLLPLLHFLLFLLLPLFSSFVPLTPSVEIIALIEFTRRKWLSLLSRP